MPRVFVRMPEALITINCNKRILEQAVSLTCGTSLPVPQPSGEVGGGRLWPEGTAAGAVWSGAGYTEGSAVDSRTAGGANLSARTCGGSAQT